MRLNGGVNRCLIVETVTDETCHAPFDLGDQSRYLRWVWLMAFRHRRGDDLTLPIRPRLLLDSRVVDMLVVSTPNFVLLSSLKPLFFNGLKNALCFSDNAGAEDPGIQ